MIYVKYSTSKFATIHEVCRETFEEQTRNKFPWEQGTPVRKQYAICPACDNPVRLVGIYRKMDKRPHRVHTEKDIEGLQRHVLQKYMYCMLSKRSKYIDDAERFTEPNESQIELCHILQNNFHKVVYIAEKILHIRGSNNFWSSTLEQFIASKGYLYPWITLENLPWMLIYFGLSQKNIFNQDIVLESKIHQVITDKCNNASFDKVIIHANKSYGKLSKSENAKGFLKPICLRFSGHKKQMIEDVLNETMTLYVDSGSVEIYKQSIEVDQHYFRNILLKPDWKESERCKKLLNSAKEIMEKYNINNQ